MRMKTSPVHHPELDTEGYGHKEKLENRGTERNAEGEESQRSRYLAEIGREDPPPKKKKGYKFTSE